jgi:hypothetical protein
MRASKEQLREIVLEIIFHSGKTSRDAWQLSRLMLEVAEGLNHRTGASQREPTLDADEKLIVQEIFWDLITIRVITVGMNGTNNDLVFFRLHSEAKTNLKKGQSLLIESNV